MSSYADTSIVINMIRGDDSKMDDKITINKNLEYGDYELTYSEYNGGNPRVVHKVNGLYREKVNSYLYNLFKNFSLDEESYMDIQAILPAMPSIIVSASKFKDVYYREHFFEMLGNSLDLLENTQVVRPLNKSSVYSEDYQFSSPPSYTTPTNIRQHIFFDECDV
jgi:hypothetical protein